MYLFFENAFLHKSIYLPFSFALIKLRQMLYTPCISSFDGKVLVVFTRFIYEKTHSLHGIL